MRHVETPESLPGGKILLTSKTREDLTSCQMEVLAVGASAYCDDPECERPHYTGHHKMPVKAGQWVLVAHRSLGESDQPDTYIIHQDELLAILEA